MAEQKRQKMPPSQRAKQFIPFAALKGFDAAIKKKESVFLQKAELSEDELDLLDRAVTTVKAGEKIAVTYYCDGAYLNVCGFIQAISIYDRILKLEDTTISLDAIVSLTSL